MSPVPVVLIVLALPLILGVVPPNPIYGFRIPRTMPPNSRSGNCSRRLSDSSSSDLPQLASALVIRYQSPE